MKDIVFTTAIGTLVIMFAAIPIQSAGRKMTSAFGGVAAILAGHSLGLILQAIARLL